MNKNSLKGVSDVRSKKMVFCFAIGCIWSAFAWNRTAHSAERPDQRCGPQFSNASCGTNRCCSWAGWCGGAKGTEGEHCKRPMARGKFNGPRSSATTAYNTLSGSNTFSSSNSTETKQFQLKGLQVGHSWLMASAKDFFGKMKKAGFAVAYSCNANDEWPELQVARITYSGNTISFIIRSGWGADAICPGNVIATATTPGKSIVKATLDTGAGIFTVDYK